MKRLAKLGAVAAMVCVGSLAVAKMAPVSDEDCVKQSSVIVVGKVKEVITREKFPPDIVVKIEVTKTLKGKAEESVTLEMPGIARNTPPKVGDEKIFLLNPREGGGYQMGVGATMFSVRDVSEQDKIVKLIEAQAEKKGG